MACRSLVHQLVAMVRDTADVKAYSVKGKPHRTAFKLTALEHAKVEFALGGELRFRISLAMRVGVRTPEARHCNSARVECAPTTRKQGIEGHCGQLARVKTYGNLWITVPTRTRPLPFTNYLFLLFAVFGAFCVGALYAAFLTALTGKSPTGLLGRICEELKLFETTDKRVLDPCCGSRMMWLDRKNPDVVFGDSRSETITVTDRSHGNAGGQRVLRVEPDVPLDFRALPYADGTFNLVAFDPPHLVRAGPKSWLAAKYGKLGEDWREDLRRGFAECFRVLATDGVLVFKWNETQVKVTEVLALTPVAPLFGHISGRKGLTHWLVFMRPNTR